MSYCLIGLDPGSDYIAVGILNDIGYKTTLISYSRLERYRGFRMACEDFTPYRKRPMTEKIIEMVKRTGWIEQSFRAIMIYRGMVCRFLTGKSNAPKSEVNSILKELGIHITGHTADAIAIALTLGGIIIEKGGIIPDSFVWKEKLHMLVKRAKSSYGISSINYRGSLPIEWLM
ncbi:MAG: hypothetical protein ACTSPV_00925 [Candidatus Hodarchaeales archaeon]